MPEKKSKITFSNIEWFLFRAAFVLFLIYELAEFFTFLYRKWFEY
jgi:hypothetical protein